MAYTTINKSTDYFNTKLYTGNGSAGHAQTGIGHQPDWVWIKNRSASENHMIFDAVRGATKDIRSDGTYAENTNSNSLTSFNSDGFTLGNLDNVNKNSDTFASWCWKAGGGQGSSNTAGSINTTYTSVNTTSGFSISSYTGTGSNATVGHGLGVAPKMIIIKDRGASSSWIVGHNSLGFTKNLFLQSNEATDTNSAIFQNTAPTSSVFSVGTSGHVNDNGNNYIAYCFAEKTGYSKFGSYTGNGNADGSFIYCGFKPAFIMLKNSSSAGTNWFIHDAARNPSNPIGYYLTADNNTADQTTALFDITSNGFKQRNSYANLNGSGDTYIFMAFAEAPLVGSNNVPCTAR